MKKSILSVILAIFVFSLFLSGCSQFSPTYTIDGDKLKIDSVKLQDTYGSGNDKVGTRSADDTFLVVHCNVVSSSKSLISWKVSLTEESLESATPVVTEQSAKEGKVKEIAWVFVVKKTSKAFVLTWPDGKTVKLDSMVTK
jgi:hypothetical protein